MDLRATAPLLALACLTGAGCATTNRVAMLERDQQRVDGELAEVRASINELKQVVASLKTRVGGGEVQGPKTGRHSVDERLRTLEGRVGVAEQSRPEQNPASDTPATSASVEHAPAATAPAGAQVDGDALRRERARQLPPAYAEALALIERRSFAAAVEALQGFLATEHDSPFAPRAQYWLGESYFQLGQYYQVILGLTDLVQRSPRSEYVPAAWFKLGLAFFALGNKSEARHAFERVTSEYPSSPQASKASAMLHALES